MDFGWRRILRIWFRTHCSSKWYRRVYLQTCAVIDQFSPIKFDFSISLPDVYHMQAP